MPDARVGRRPPGPNIVELGWLSLRHAADPFALLPQIASRYGDVVDLPVPMLGSTTTLLSHPDHVEHIFVRDHSRYHRHHLTSQLVPGEPDVLPVLEGEEWRRWRRPLNPHFGEEALAARSRSMAAAVSAGMDAWAPYTTSGQWIDLEHELGAVVMDALLRSMFSTVLDPETLGRYVDAARDLGKYTIGRALMSAFPRFLPRPFQRRGEAAQRTFLGELDKLIVRRQAEGPRDVPDILDALMGMTFDGCPQMAYRRLRTELSSLVFAGFETTAESVSWCLALLHDNTSALAKAYAEVDALAGAPIEYATLAQLPFVRACFDEALRTEAPPGILRTAAEDDTIDGYHIPKGSHVLVSPFGLHRDSRFWSRPEEFEPSRFLTGKINRNAYIPFGIGPRKCLGWRLAYIDGLMTLAAVLQRYTIEIRPGWKPKPTLRISTGLVDGFPVCLTTR
ncbi:cytochrome P450 [Mycobacterium sp. 3519A]|uniref:cytochrome P450 n=1 Tax=Mycobacterium sp. 3519A TaxID=2057184 RepID=UPI000C797B49|nr:cytochrome P450 [Mycobacterium sp. 3519A]